jgi:hypothetical protein
VITELNIAGNYLGLDGRDGTDLSGVIALADVIPEMGALTSLDVSNQADEDGDCGLGAEGAKHLAEALKDHA